MKILSVNVSLPKKIAHNGKMVTTGIFKEPVDRRVMLRSLNLDGDGQADLIGHGGEYKAAYVYTFENYGYWENELGRSDFTYGQFGENLTVEGMLDDAVHIGDVFRMGSALVEVTQPRVPCFKLGIKMGIEGFENVLLSSDRLGFYLRVLEKGDVGAGDRIELVKTDSRRMTVSEVNNLLYFDLGNLEQARNALRIEALSPGWRGSFEDRLAKAKKSGETPEGFRTLVVDRKVRESETITSFYLVPEDGKPLAPFLPGQFLPMRLDIPGQPRSLTRTYTLSDCANPDYYRLSIKREPPPKDRPDLPPGLSSNYFHDRIDVGSRIRTKPPRGKFHLDVNSDKPVVLVSAGVGLTPMISMLNAIVKARTGRPTWFVHGARNGRELAMGNHVRHAAAENDNVIAHIRFSRPGPEDVEGRDYDSAGRVDVDLLSQILPGKDADIYFCGPTPFMKSLFNGLIAWGLPEERIHYEFFGPATSLKDSGEPKAADGEFVDGSTNIKVTFARSGVSANWAPSFGTILDMAEGLGLNPDYSCRSGICHTCMAQLIEGDVDYLEDPLDAPDPGHVLICCSRPKGDLIIDA